MWVECTFRRAIQVATLDLNFLHHPPLSGLLYFFILQRITRYINVAKKKHTQLPLLLIYAFFAWVLSFKTGSLFDQTASYYNQRKRECSEGNSILYIFFAQLFLYIRIGINGFLLNF